MQDKSDFLQREVHSSADPQIRSVSHQKVKILDVQKRSDSPSEVVFLACLLGTPCRIYVCMENLKFFLRCQILKRFNGRTARFLLNLKKLSILDRLDEPPAIRSRAELQQAIESSLFRFPVPGRPLTVAFTCDPRPGSRAEFPKWRAMTLMVRGLGDAWMVFDNQPGIFSVETTLLKPRDFSAD